MADAITNTARCEKCGRCCYAKLIIDGEVVYTPFPCPHLDEETRLCTVYARRHEANPQCLTVEMGIRLGLFPPDCPFVRDLPHYDPPRMRLTREESEAVGQAVLGSQEKATDLPSRPPGRRRARKTKRG